MSANITHSAQETARLLATPQQSHLVSLTTFRRNGEGVVTPVGIVASAGKLYFMTPAKTWKAKRLAKNPRVTLAPGSRKGELLGPLVEGTARRLSNEEAKRARVLLRRGIAGHIFNILFNLRYPGDKTAVYEITLSTEEADRETAS